jgi:hypothetical protein
MPFVWEEYLFLARHLQTYTSMVFSQEAAFRCAVSRSYYAAFCHAKITPEIIRGLFLAIRLMITITLKPTSKKRDTRVATSLDKLRQWRNQCDYDDTVSGLTPLLSSAIAEAQKIFNLL